MSDEEEPNENTFSVDELRKEVRREWTAKDAHDRHNSLAGLKDFIDWSFHAPQRDKRLARSSMVVLSTASMLLALAAIIGTVLF